MEQEKIDLGKCHIGFMHEAPDITGALMFLSIRYGGVKWNEKNKEPFYKRNGKKKRKR